MNQIIGIEQISFLDVPGNHLVGYCRPTGVSLAEIVFDYASIASSCDLQELGRCRALPGLPMCPHFPEVRSIDGIKAEGIKLRVGRNKFVLWTE